MKKTFFLIQLFGLGIAVALSACNSDDAAAPPPAAPPFGFATQAPDSFVRVDRMGQPVTGTLLLSRDPVAFPTTTPNPPNSLNSSPNQRDAFNRGEPINDAADFAGLLTTGPQPNTLRNLHFETGPSLRSLGLTPCSTETVVPPATNADVNITTCVAQAAPVILPDVITFDFSAPPGWPNGRSFDDPVVDRFLAAGLLDLSVHNINTLVGVVNATLDETGTPSPTAFPHMRPANP